MTTNSFASPPVSRHRRLIALLSLAVVIVLILLAGRAWYLYQTRTARIDLVKAGLTQALILAPSDVARAQVQTLVTGLPITGAIRAKDTVLIKARVGGTLRDLTMREGDAVQAGQVIARVEPTEYDQRYQQAQLQAESARAQVDIAQRQYDNNAALVQQGFISQTALATSRANLDAAQANYRAAQAGAAIAQQSVADTVLTAPITGTVSRRLAQPGEHVAPGSPVVEIVDLDHLELEAAVSPGDSLQVRVGQTADLMVEGVPDAVIATVARINPSTQEGNRNVLVYLSVPAQTGAPELRQGLFAQGILETGEARTLAVPLDAVRTDRPQPYVQVIKDDHVRLLPVQMGVRGIVHQTASANGRNGETWVAVRAVGSADAAASAPSGASVSIQPGDWTLRSAAGALSEGTAVRLPRQQSE